MRKGGLLKEKGEIVSIGRVIGGIRVWLALIGLL